jgi:hypothetical protein
MAFASQQARARRQKTALLSLTALAVLLPVSACSSGGSAAASGTSNATTAAQGACQQVTAVLADGPDPGADPVGYAQAQVLPLRQIQTSDATLGAAIGALAAAYGSYSAADGKSTAATTTLNAAISKINTLCPAAGASL